MKAWVLAGAFSALGIPMASAATTDCDGEEVRSTLTVEHRQAGGVEPPSAQQAEVLVRPAPPARQPPPRRRTGKHIPDAELIGVHGTL